ncbi:hypothetical protein KRR26_06260 [Corallococcus sp. M34]|uniref:hypothetical protein n=1 Tax=Citreicoccus inhibens TaxID=2849499 RepID=UPI001C24FC9E|nr:hypothetical protein [Citreicoccus inhibens]MBU8895199.1 hypothetical protein [Citreicoccus inhibens]
MRAWGVGVVGCLWMLGCGGTLPEAGVSPDEQTEPRAAEDTSERVADAWCLPGPADTARVKRILPPSPFPGRLSEAPESLTDFNGTLFFAINFEDGRRALWKSDGSEAGTAEVKSFPLVTLDTRVRQLTAATEQLFFTLTDSLRGSELWVTRGSTVTTKRLFTFGPGIQHSFVTHLTTLGNRLVFLRESHPPDPTLPHAEIWTSNGNDTGTVQLRDLGAGTFPTGEQLALPSSVLFFIQAPSGLALWTSNGTAGATTRMKQLSTSPNTVFPGRVLVVGTEGFFTLSRLDGSTEVWATDGTSAGTVRLDTFGPARRASLLGVMNGALYLTVTSVPAQLLAVYRMDIATGAQTPIVTLPNPYIRFGEAYPYLDAASVGRGRIFFSMGIGSAGPAPRDSQLWVTDGTAAGTRLLRRPLSLSDEYGSPVVTVRDNLTFFAAQSGSIEPWVTDGTLAGTKLLKDIAPITSSYPREYTRIGDRVFFSALDDSLANQLWSTRLRDTCRTGEREEAAAE